MLHLKRLFSGIRLECSCGCNASIALENVSEMKKMFIFVVIGNSLLLDLSRHKKTNFGIVFFVFEDSHQDEERKKKCENLLLTFVASGSFFISCKSTLERIVAKLAKINTIAINHHWESCLLTKLTQSWLIALEILEPNIHQLSSNADYADEIIAAQKRCINLRWFAASWHSILGFVQVASLCAWLRSANQKFGAISNWMAISGSSTSLHDEFA